MRSAPTRRLTPLAAALLLACGADARSAVEPRFNSSDGPEWSDPVNLGPVVNSAANDNNPTLTADELTMYFASNRPDGHGDVDIWVTTRASRSSPWKTPVNLGPPINTEFIDGAPGLSPDGHLLFIHSNRPGTMGGNDIWMAHRSGSKKDLDWETPVPLGPDVNTADDEQGPEFVASERGGALYFNRGNQMLSRSDLYRAGIDRDGDTDGPAQLLAELSDPTTNDAAPTVRADAREILFWSARAGGLGATDIYRSTRQSANDPWSPPVNVGPPLNSLLMDLHPEFSPDALTLYFSSNRAVGFGGQDLWVSTRAGSAKK